MKTVDCTNCDTYLADLLLEGTPSPEASDHLAACDNCRREWDELRATWAVMDSWTAPSPSAYFDSRLHARLREAQAEAPEGLWERMASYLRFSTGRGLRPVLAGAFVLATLLGGGTTATILLRHGDHLTSPTVNDLRIYDNNAQAIQQMDLLDEPGPDASRTPQT